MEGDGRNDLGYYEENRDVNTEQPAKIPLRNINKHAVRKKCNRAKKKPEDSAAFQSPSY